ncbi:MAG: hypothetical protein ACO3QQ_07115 [Candidatus Nanopelagicaceae bacterium]
MTTLARPSSDLSRIVSRVKKPKFDQKIVNILDCFFNSGKLTESEIQEYAQIGDHYAEDTYKNEEPQDGGIIQPKGRKGYFMPVMSGTLNTKFGPTQLVEASSVGWADENDEYWSEFRVANLIFKDDEPISVYYRHYNYDYQTSSWKEIAGYEATFK